MDELLDVPAIIKIPPKLKPVITDFNKYQICLLEGGRGSGKSHSIARFLLFLGEERKIRVVCGREQQNSIEESVYQLLVDLIDEYELAYDVQKTKITHKKSGTTFKFKGFREQGRVNIKGLEGIDILWIDEAQSITKDTLDIIMPTIRKDNARIFFTMNRFLREDAVPSYAIGRPETLHIQINFHENPYCPLILKMQAEDMRVRNPKDYRHIWLGEPLTASSDFLFNFDKLHASFDVKPYGDIFFYQRILGIDFAAQGDDLCVATVLDRKSNQHWSLTERQPWDEPDTMVSVGKVVNMIGEYKPNLTIMDVSGLGKPVYDRLNEVMQGTGNHIEPFDGGSTGGVDTKAYANKRAQAYFTLREWFDQGFLCIDRKDKEVINELEKIKMKYRSNGVRLIQSKVDMKKPPPIGVGFSPDNADSLMMAVWGAVNCLGKPSNTGTGADKTGGAGQTVTRKSSNRQRRR